MLILLGGLGAGLLHVISGPDHLAAVAPLAVKRQRGAWLTGLRWGAGHAAGVALVGLLSLLLRELLPLELISSWSERLVGVLLIGIGAWVFRSAWQVHTHEHEHDGHTHGHIHIHGKAAARRHQHSHMALGIGALHGLAGSSHFLAILPSLALPSTTLAVAYLLAYGVGTVIAMVGFASMVNAFSHRFARTANVYRGFMFACSVIAILIGGCWLLGFSFE